MAKGSTRWWVEVNDGVMYAPDLEAAKRIFVENYDQAQTRAQLGPGSGPGGGDDRENFTIVTLPRAFSPSAAMTVDDWARLGVFPRAGDFPADQP